jgi:hypothetical protein
MHGRDDPRLHLLGIEQLPRCRVRRNERPRIACAAIAPRQTRISGRTIEISASSHGRQAPIWAIEGFRWSRRFPRMPSHRTVLDRVGQVHLVGVHSGLRQGSVEQRSRWPHERTSLPVLPIAGLLTDQHQCGWDGPLPEDGLRPEVVEVAAGAGAGRALHGGAREPCGQEGRVGGVLGGHAEGVTRVLRGYAPWPVHTRRSAPSPATTQRESSTPHWATTSSRIWSSCSSECIGS